jgi:hypothetical protein
MSARTLFLPALMLTLLALTGCVGQLKTAGPQPEVDEGMIARAVAGMVRISEFKGFGEITMVNSGQKMTGKFDALRKNSGFFSAQIYSPFGSTVASISANDFKGRVNVGREHIDFTYDDTMEKVPFPCARHFTYGSFVKVLTSSMPDEFWTLSAGPHKVIPSKKRKKTVTAAWVSDELAIRAEVIPRSGQFESVTFDYNVGGSKLTMRFGRFRKGVPYVIHVRETSKNHITVNYESIHWK